MIDFDITDINEAIDGLSYEEQLEYLNDKENEVDETIDELQNLSIEIMELKERILRDAALLALHNAGYDIQTADDDDLTFDVGEATITIYFYSAPFKINFSFFAYKDQSTYRKTISALVPEYECDGNHFSKDVTEDTMIDEIVSLVRRLMDK